MFNSHVIAIGLDDHEILPGLKWISNDTEAKISLDIAKHAASDWCWYACNSVAEWDEELLSQIRRFNFRYVRRETIVRGDDWRGFVNRLWEVVCFNHRQITRPTHSFTRSF